MDMNVLLAAQLLMEQVAAEGSGPLLYPLYHHLLFHFHLWALSDFPVRLGRCEPRVGGAAGPGDSRSSKELHVSLRPRDLPGLGCGRGTRPSPGASGGEEGGKGPGSARRPEPSALPAQATPSTWPA